MTDPYVCMMYIVSPLAGLCGGILWRPPAYSLLCVRSRVDSFPINTLTLLVGRQEGHLAC